MRKYCLVVVLTLLFVNTASAQVPDQDNSEAQWGSNPILLIPDGTGDLLSDVGNEIHVWLRDSSGNPVSGIPADQIYIEYFYIYPPLPFCYNSGPDIIARAIAATDAEGHAVIDGRIFGNDANGHNFNWVALQVTAPHVSWELDWTWTLTVVSPDINGDFKVDLSDVGPFTALFQAGNPRVDFNHDTFVNVQDVVVFSSAIGAECP